MAIYGAFTHAKLFLNGLNLTGDTNLVKIEASKEVKDRTVFGNVSPVRVMGGLADITLSAAGFHNNADPGQDVNFRANLYADDICTTVMIPLVAKTAVAVGDLAYFFKGSQAQYVTGEAQGNDLLWNLSLQGGELGYPLCMGYVLETGDTAKTIDGNGTGYQAGAVSASQYLYAALHVTEVSASDSIIVTIESDDNAGFTSATTRVTFSSFAAVGAEFAARVAGAITDDYWRAVFNVTGAGVSIKCAVAIAIQ